jgi:RNA polymerase sigma factor (sigma-70 family)
MSRAPIESVLHHLRGLVVDPDTAALADRALLERFLTRHDETAFEALVRRHGPMVLGVCRRVLSSAQDAEDAFQATFLVLVRKAASIARPELLGNWLYGVAFQTARTARAAADRRRAKEARAMPRQPTPEADDWRELRPVLDEELSGLPAKYRLPVVLCHLQGQSRQDAARALGVPEGTLSSRLARARSILARRLARRGVTLSAVALAVALGPEATAAVLPSALIVTTVQAGARALAGPLAAGAVSALVAALTERVVKAMWLSKLTLTLAGLVAGGIVALGVGAFAARQIRAAQPARQELAPARAAPPAPREGAGPPLQQAVKATQAITDPREKFSTLLRIAAFQYETGDAAGARKTCRAALEVARGLPDDRPKVDALALGLAPIQAEAGDRAAAAETLKLARQAADAIEGAQQKGNALVSLARGHCISGDYAGALRAAKDSGDYQSAALGLMASALHKTDKPAARKALREAVEMLQALPESNQRQWLPNLAAAQVKVGDLEGALKAIEPLGPWKFTGQEAVAVAQAQTGDVAGALKTLKEMEGDPPRGLSSSALKARGEVLNAVARAQAQAGDRAAAEGALKSVRRVVAALYEEEAKRAAGPRAPFGPRGYSQAAQLEARIPLTQFQLGDHAAALETARGIRTDYEKAQALLDLGEAAAAAGKREQAREYLVTASRALEKARPGTDFRNLPARNWPSASVKSATLRRIAHQQANVGDVREALRTVERIASPQEQKNALALIVPAQAAAGDAEGALRTLERLTESSLKRNALEGLVAALVKAGDERGAMAVVEKQKPPGMKAHALLGLAKGRAKEKDGKK